MDKSFKDDLKTPEERQRTPEEEKEYYYMILIEQLLYPIYRELITLGREAEAEEEIVEFIKDNNEPVTEENIAKIKAKLAEMTKIIEESGRTR